MTQPDAEAQRTKATPGPATAKPKTSFERMLSLAGQIVGLSALAGTIMLAFRALVEARFDYTVATAILAHSSPTLLAGIAAMNAVTVGVATVVAIVTFKPIVAVFQRVRTAEPDIPRPKKLRILLAALPAYAALVLILPFAFPWILIVGILLSAGVTRLIENNPEPVTLGLKYFRGQAIAAFVLVSLLFGYWSAPERVVVDGQPQTVQVLDDSGDYLVALDSYNGVVIRIPKESVTERQYCAPPTSTKPLLVQWLLGETTVLPACPPPVPTDAELPSRPPSGTPSSQVSSTTSDAQTDQ